MEKDLAKTYSELDTLTWIKEKIEIDPSKVVTEAAADPSSKYGKFDTAKFVDDKSIEYFLKLKLVIKKRYAGSFNTTTNVTTEKSKHSDDVSTMSGNEKTVATLSSRMYTVEDTMKNMTNNMSTMSTKFDQLLVGLANSGILAKFFTNRESKKT